MNIFILDDNPRIAAKMVCDKHIVKMILESAQMLSTAHRVHNSKYVDKVYKATHINHPCTKWTCESSENYAWHLELWQAMIVEYSIRYSKVHKCVFLNQYLLTNPCPDGDMTSFPQAMPQEYWDVDPVIAYRNYYKGEKSYFAKWKMGNVPEWFK